MQRAKPNAEWANGGKRCDNEIDERQKDVPLYLCLKTSRKYSLELLCSFLILVSIAAVVGAAAAFDMLPSL